jgi:hypothetical protein
MASAPAQVPKQHLRQVATVAMSAEAALRLFSGWSRHRVLRIASGTGDVPQKVQDHGSGRPARVSATR